MRQSSFLQTVGSVGQEEVICFHSLYGPGEACVLYEKEYIDTLESFSTPRPVSSGDSEQIISDLVKAGFLVDDQVSREQERQAYDRRVEDWLNEIIGGTKIEYLDLMVSEACNFACGHCSRKYTYDKSGKRQTGLMSWETARKAIDLYLRSFPRSRLETAEIHFGSDEPLLNWPVLRACIEYVRSIEPEAVLTVNTNLSLLTREKALFLRDQDIEIIASLDGPRSGNDLVRVSAGGNGTFDKILAQARLLREIGYPLSGFITTILDANWDHIDQGYVEWIAGEGYKSLALDVDLVNSMGHNPAECAEKLTLLHDHILDQGMFAGGAWKNPAKLIIDGAADGMPAHCKSIKGCGIAVTSSGYIQTCSGCGTAIGHIDDPADVFAEKSIYHQLISAKLKTVGTCCDGCMLEAVCKNQCFMTSSGLEEQESPRKREMCYILKEGTKHLLRKKLQEDLETN